LSSCRGCALCLPARRIWLAGHEILSEAKDDK
jgi:hypothetical protein